MICTSVLRIEKIVDDTGVPEEARIQAAIVKDAEVVTRLGRIEGSGTVRNC